MINLVAILQITYYRLFPPELPPAAHGVLRLQLPYYAQLDADAQMRFRRRLAILLKLKTFLPAAGLPAVSDEMRWIIGGGIVQVTFGLRSSAFRYFRTIYVAPARYRFGMFPQRFLGHVDLQEQTIVLSWQDVKNGFRIPDDALNVLIHECAHALEAEHRLRNFGMGIFSPIDRYWWQQYGRKKLQTIRRSENRFLKAYGGKNLGELFAVGMEAFFEQPEHFRRELPELDDVFCRMLRQDPTRRGDPTQFRPTARPVR